MEKWKTCPQALPEHDAIVWLRINYWFGQAFQARYSADTQTFTSVVNSITYPVWCCSRWRNL